MKTVALVLTVVALPSTAFAHQNSGGMTGQNRTQSDQSSSGGVSQSAQGSNMGDRYGPSMMRGGYGHGMIGDDCGPGMMGRGYGHRMMGHGYGPGMMRSGYGHEMMGRGYGPGMMQGFSFGPKAMASLNLSSDQRHKIDQIQEQNFRKQQQLRIHLYEDMVHMHKLMASDNPDTNTVGQTYKSIAKARKKLFHARLEMSKSLKSVLTPAQQKTLRESWGSMDGFEQPDH